MNVTDHHSDIHEQANQMGSTLCSFAVAAIVGFILWTSGSGVPWWVYPILFLQSVAGFARMLSDKPAGGTAELGWATNAADESADVSMAERGVAPEYGNS